jgi:hypothetical protein
MFKKILKIDSTEVNREKKSIETILIALKMNSNNSKEEKINMMTEEKSMEPMIKDL